MLNSKKQKEYLEYLVEQLANSRKIDISLNRAWTKKFPDDAGVYVFFEKNNVVYVGETKSLRERMGDMLNTRHHTLRRKIGAFNFSKIAGYQKATSKKSFSANIEKLVIDYMENKMKMSFIPVSLGRKEVEEYISGNNFTKYNSPSKRGLKNKKDE